MQGLDRDSPVPFYHQLKTILLEQIHSMDPQAENPIPTERELQAKFGVSRSVVRQAVDALVNEGYVVRQQGRGTFVRPEKLRHNPQADSIRTHGLSGFIKAQGMEPRFRLLSHARTTPDPRAAEALELTPNVDVLRFERLRLADETPVGLHVVTLPWMLGEQLQESDMVYGDSSLDYLRERLKLTISQSTRTIEATALDAGTAKVLQAAVGSPALRIRRTVRDPSGRAMEFFEGTYRGDAFEYHLQFDHDRGRP